MNNGRWRQAAQVGVGAGARRLGAAQKKYEAVVSWLEAELAQRDFHVCYRTGGKAANRAQTQTPAAAETADPLTPSLGLCPASPQLALNAG